MCIRLDIISQHDGQTDGRTEMAISSSALLYMLTRDTSLAYLVSNNSVYMHDIRH